MAAMGQEFVIVISILLTAVCSAQSGVRGPPQAEQKEVKKVGRIGENIRLTCPIVGFPSPIVEWSKNGEKIDYMWERHKTGRKSLKIKNVSEDDTGIFTCKGINGFGSEEVRIELIVVDPRILPQGLDDNDVAPPVFTYETKASKKTHVKAIGDTFKISCEALGSPQPEIFWFKDGQHIDESVHYQRGRSTVEFNVLGTADAGVYTCRARNLIGELTLNYTLEVEQPAGAPHAIVTEAGPTNMTVFVGEEATLQCKVKSIAPPHIKWLKKLDAHEITAENTLRVGHERYRILETNLDVSIGSDEYLNKLVIGHAALQDAGLYICFVTNSGFGALTYKSLTLRVEHRPEIQIDIHNETPEGQGGEPMAVMIVVICLSVTVGILLVLILSCVIVKRLQRRNKDNIHCETGSSTGSSDVERPFMRAHHNILLKNNNMNNKPLPPTPMTLAQWSNAIHPGCNNKYSDSGFNDHDNSKELYDANNAAASCNQYEVPFAHLVRPYRPPEDIYFSQEAFLQPQNSVASGYAPNLYRQRYYEYETQ